VWLTVLFTLDTVSSKLKLADGSDHPPHVYGIADEKYPLFVSWKKKQKNGDEYHLRGCIGTFSPKELKTGLKEYAIISAFEDSRFSPLTKQEVPLLKCDVSLLTNFEPALNLDDWKVGIHGVQIFFKDGEKNYSATYLPEVASEQGWSRTETIKELVSKSGFKRTLTTEVKSRIKLVRYQSSCVSLSYEEYCQLKVTLLSGPQKSLVLKVIGDAPIKSSASTSSALSSSPSLSSPSLSSPASLSSAPSSTSALESSLSPKANAPDVSSEDEEERE